MWTSTKYNEHKSQGWLPRSAMATVQNPTGFAASSISSSSPSTDSPKDQPGQETELNSGPTRDDRCLLFMTSLCLELSFMSRQDYLGLSDWHSRRMVPDRWGASPRCGQVVEESERWQTEFARLWFSWLSPHDLWTQHKIDRELRNAQTTKEAGNS